MRGRPAEARDRSSAYWDGIASATGAAKPPLWRLHADRATLALLDRWLPAERRHRVLKTDLYDESCTAGLAPSLGERSDVVVGIDVSTVVARRAAADGAVLAVACDVRRLPFRSGSFDAVVSNSTLDHFAHGRDIDRGLRELERVLADAGSLIVTLDNPRHPLVGLRQTLAPLWQRLGVVPYPLGATYGSRALHEALAASGFEVLEMTAVHHFPRIVLVAAQRLLRGPLVARLLRVADRAERLGTWPTRFLTGQYVAALARPARRAASRE
ncbi:MAG: class I SAM-dependent methyltransferase, partial [Thermodesulfobacteriota bacterium]